MKSVLNPEMLLTPAEVAKIFRVSTKTIKRWADAGEIPVLITPGNHYRFSLTTIREFLGECTNDGNITIR